MFSDFLTSFGRPGRWAYTTWFRFIIGYRKMAIGPLWILARPILFVLFLGALFVGLSNFTTSVFIPHLLIGLIVWTIIGGMLTRAPSLYERNRGNLLQGHVLHSDIILTDTSELVVHFLHQAVLIVGVCIFYGSLENAWGVAASLFGLLVLIINALWFNVVFGILGARFHDLKEFLTTLSGIAFLATPIIWMPQDIEGDVVSAKVPFIEAYINYNPFFHYLDIVRAPLMGDTVSQTTWTFVGVTTVVGMILATIMYKRYRRMVPLWV